MVDTNVYFQDSVRRAEADRIAQGEWELAPIQSKIRFRSTRQLGRRIQTYTQAVRDKPAPLMLCAYGSLFHRKSSYNAIFVNESRRCAILFLAGFWARLALF